MSNDNDDDDDTFLFAVLIEICLYFLNYYFWVWLTCAASEDWWWVLVVWSGVLFHGPKDGYLCVGLAVSHYMDCVQDTLGQWQYMAA